jgi:hypothetical protein
MTGCKDHADNQRLAGIIAEPDLAVQTIDEFVVAYLVTNCGLGNPKRIIRIILAAGVALRHCKHWQ